MKKYSPLNANCSDVDLLSFVESKTWTLNANVHSAPSLPPNSRRRQVAAVAGASKLSSFCPQL